MNLVALEKELNRVSRELSLTGELTDSRFIEIKAEIDQVKLEIAALGRFLEQAHPSFAREFPKIREEIVQEVNPEVG